MKLERFRAMHYRSINESGSIDVSRVTAILGRNESGKSNLLRALHSLNPPGGIKALNRIKDFPRHRKLSDCEDGTWMLQTTWSLSGDERASLKEAYARISDATTITVWRRYDDKRYVGFNDLEPLTFDKASVNTAFRKVTASIQAAADPLDAAKKAALLAAVGAFSKAAAKNDDPASWAEAAKPQLQAIRKALAVAGTSLPDDQDKVLANLEEQQEAASTDAEQATAARAWILKHLPTFIYVDEYPDFEGHQDIASYAQRKAQNQLKEADLNFEKLCKVAGLDPAQLQQLGGQGDHETRNQLVNRAGAVVTAAIRKLWKDRSLKVRFNLDSQHLDTLISDPNSAYDVEVNLDDRSRGFKWFFSFYITFAADTQGGSAANAILLLDEPGLYLHARSQGDLLAHFEKDFKNQIIYTTHSPFMVPTNHLETIRTVSIEEEAGTTVTNDPTGDARTLFPLQAALGYDLSQSLFVGPRNLIVEGVTDYWYLSAASTYLAERGQASLGDQITLTPAGGAQKIPYMVALLTSEKLNVVALLDHEKEALATKQELLKNKLLIDRNVVFVSEAFEGPTPHEADIEDLLEPAVFEALILESYSKELSSIDLKLNPNVPRIAVRYELAFKEAGIPFHKTRPARLYLKRMGDGPEAIMAGETAKRFSRLFQAVTERFKD